MSAINLILSYLIQEGGLDTRHYTGGTDRDYTGGRMDTKGGAGRGLSRLDLTVGRFFFRAFGKMSSGWETVELNQMIRHKRSV